MSLTVTLHTYVVNSANDGACDVLHCSLREAIHAANAGAGLDNIFFNIAGAGLHTIRPTGKLPSISDPDILDATTEPDDAGTPVIELEGSTLTRVVRERVTPWRLHIGIEVVFEFQGSGTWWLDHTFLGRE